MNLWLSPYMTRTAQGMDKLKEQPDTDTTRRYLKRTGLGGDTETKTDEQIDTVGTEKGRKLLSKAYE
jgi:hypothetical protein